MVRGGEVLLIAPRAGSLAASQGARRARRGAAGGGGARGARGDRRHRARARRRCPASTTAYEVDGRVRIHKRVDYYLMAYVDGSERDSDPREVVAARWFAWDEALPRSRFDNEREVVRRGAPREAGRVGRRRRTG